MILLAALDRVPESHIEAATLEGASEFTIFFKIKIPMIWDVLVTALTLWGINSVKEFALLYAWGGGVDIPPDGATNIAVRMYITALYVFLSMSKTFIPLRAADKDVVMSLGPAPATITSYTFFIL